jgi:hypothetical protein
MKKTYDKPVLKKESQLREVTLKSTKPPKPTKTKKPKK